MAAAFKPLLGPTREVDLLADSASEEEPGDLRLPWGIRKTVLQEGISEDHPVTGDEVRIHFDVRLLDGTVIGSSRDGDPFEFVINQRPLEIIQGLEIAVQTMKKGEVAEFTIAPRFAYDDLGSPPLVPPNTTLVFETELLGWQNKTDVLGDGRAIKTIEDRGSGSKPQPGQDVVVSLTITSRKGAVMQRHEKLDHTVGEKDFGIVSPIISQVLQTMVEGERCKVLLRRFAGDKVVDTAHSGANMDLTLERVYVTSDLLPEQSGLLTKKLLAAGTDDPPREADVVALRVDRVLVGGVPAEHFSGPHDLNFPLGSGEVCDALDFAAATMQVGEEAKLVCRSPLHFSDARLGLDSALEASFDVRLVGVTRVANASAMALEQRLQFAAQRKEIASKCFKEGRYRFALELYKRLTMLFDGEEGLEFCNICELNRAACFLKLGRPHETREICSCVLERDPNSVKARYRRASAEFQLSNFSAALRDLQTVLKQQPANSEARNLADRVREAQRCYSQKAKATAARMMGDKLAVQGDGQQSESACASLQRLARSLIPCIPAALKA